MRGLQSAGSERFSGCFALLLGLDFFPRFFQGLHEQRAVFRIFRFALGGFAESDGSRGEISGVHGNKPKVKTIIVLARIEVYGTAKIGLRISDFAAPRAGNRKVI